ncbi:MAG: hypothetical protein JRJ18_18320, partial [Deltaproteobacteria bacterium]|nr:hypothetical protein [Deltaproteobacteria bacterium]
ELPPQKVLEKKRTFNETARYAVSTSLPEERRSRSFRELELIFKITELLRGSPDVDEMLERVLVFLFETLPRIDRAAIVLYDEKTGELGRMVSRTREEVNDEGVSYSRTVMNRVIEDGKAVRMSDTNYEEPSGLTEGMNTLLIRSVLCVRHLRGFAPRALRFQEGRPASPQQPERPGGGGHRKRPVGGPSLAGG